MLDETRAYLPTKKMARNGGATKPPPSFHYDTKGGENYV
jgi:hypothetical protein